MGAWRKAGVWLGLVEDDPRYEDGPDEDGRYDDRRYDARRSDDRRYADDELDTYEDEFEEPVARPDSIRCAARQRSPLPEHSASLPS